MEFVSEYTLTRDYPDCRLDVGDIVIYQAFWKAKVKEWRLNDD